jgi:hypothetical protein
MKLAAVLLAALTTVVPSRVLLTFQDPAITESSGLVDLGSLMVTMNDSGGDAVVYAVDGRGRTVGRTTYASSVTDVEALAPAGRDAVWVGDIGDNLAARSYVRVYRVPVGRGDRTVDAPSYKLVYPDGPHDAESMTFGRDGRLRIVTKGVLGGRVYVAPKRLDPARPNGLRRGPEVDLWATDAALFRDGRHVLVRGYGSALVATYPAFAPVGYLDLPEQEQGEGVSIGPGDRIRLSSEGAHSRVLQVTLPDDVRAAMEPAQAPSPAPGVDDEGLAHDPGEDDPPWLWLAGGTAAVMAFGWLVLRRGRRT